MEWALRPFLNHWPEMVWPVLERWSDHENYHVRRLVSEGTRPRLPWGIGISAPVERAVPLLTKLHGDPTRYVTRSISNHLNDITKSNPALVLNTLEDWAKQGQQDHAELAWMMRHALRGLVKTGDPRAMSILGYRSDLEAWSRITLLARWVRIDTKLTFDVEIHAPAKAPVMVDYVISFHRPNGRTARKVFKLKQAIIPASGVLNLAKRHHFKGNATTFALYPGPHRIALQINGVRHAEEKFDLIE